MKYTLLGNIFQIDFHKKIEIFSIYIIIIPRKERKMEISKEITDAVRKAVNKAGSQSELSRLAGVSQGTISDILSVNRRRNSFSRGTFHSLFPFIRQFLPKSYTRNTPAVSVTGSPDVPPAVAAVLASVLSPAEKAEIISHLYELAASPPKPAAQEPLVVPCPSCGKDAMIPSGAGKFFCCHCGQKIQFKD